jgi:hypothetical protein
MAPKLIRDSGMIQVDTYPWLCGKMWWPTTSRIQWLDPQARLCGTRVPQSSWFVTILPEKIAIKLGLSSIWGQLQMVFAGRIPIIFPYT